MKYYHLHIQPMVTSEYSFTNLGVLDPLGELPCIFSTSATIKIKKKETWKVFLKEKLFFRSTQIFQKKK